MKITEFRIQNFKGIKNTRLKLGKQTAPIHTLVGLNESGKTTILEAINAFRPDLDGMHVLAQKATIVEGKDQLVPKSRLADFTGDVAITATVELSEDDASAVRKYAMRDLGLELDASKLPKSIEITKYFRYDNSKFRSEGSTWPIKFFLKSSRQKSYTEHYGSTEQWQKLVKFIGLRLPRIIYFPNFLFEFPDRILISGDLTQKSESDRQIINYFIAIIKDALSSLTPPLDLNRHVVDRIIKSNESDPFAIFIPWWLTSQESRAVKDVMERLGQHLTREVLGLWKQVLGRDLHDTEIEVDSFIEPNATNGSREVFLTFTVKQGRSRYKISERSLGFRWFFCFLLFTRFSRGSSGDVQSIFLFDEPASNLHSKAQAQLLESLSVIAGGKNTIVYSTHSHHLVNPLWLENAFIVSNGLNYDKEFSGDFEPTEIDITALPYRTFVGKHGDKSHYFQPILDRIDYSPSKLEATRVGVVVEGKSDYYILNWYKKFVDPKLSLDFLPVGGVTNAKAVLSLYLGVSRNFLFLVDSDSEGKKARQTYLENLPIQERSIVELEEVFGKAKKIREIEDLLSIDVKQEIAALHGTSKFTKAQAVQYFSSALFQKDDSIVDAKTSANLGQLVNFLVERLEALSEQA